MTDRWCKGCSPLIVKPVVRQRSDRQNGADTSGPLARARTCGSFGALCEQIQPDSTVDTRHVTQYILT